MKYMNNNIKNNNINNRQFWRKLWHMLIQVVIIFFSDVYDLQMGN